MKKPVRVRGLYGVKFAHNTLIRWSLERQKACTITIGTVPCKGVMRAWSTSFSGFRALAARRGPAYSLASSGESGGYHHQNSHGHAHAESTFKAAASHRRVSFKGLPTR